MPIRKSILIVLLLCLSAAAGDWPFFRGPNRDGKSDEPNLPLEWSKTKNVKWKAPLPQRGNSGPIIVGDRVFVVSTQDKPGHQRTLYCFARADGKKLWEQTIAYEPNEPTHGTNPHGAATPASDGQRVVVWHGSGGLYCYDIEGKQLWKTDLGEFRHIWGYAASPVIHGDRVYLNCGPGNRTFVVAINKADGKIAWQTDEPGGADDKSPVTKGWLGSWGTPLIGKFDGQEQLLVPMPQHVNAYDLATGKIVWHCGGTGPLAYTDVVLGESIAVYASGFSGPAIGFKPGGAGDITESRRLWRVAQKNPQRISSGIIVEKHFYIANEPGVIQCIEIETGKEAWSHRVAGNTFWSPMVAAPGRLYVTSQKGTTFVFAPDPAGFKLLATNELAEHVNAVPALAHGHVFIRTGQNLYCIGGN